MDWIDVGIEVMEGFNFDKRKLGLRGLDVFIYIFVIDVVWELI